MYCENCGNLLKDNDKFCCICGAKVEPEEVVSYCQYCGNILNPDNKFCTICGAATDDSIIIGGAEPGEKGKFRKVVAVFLALGIVVGSAVAVISFKGEELKDVIGTVLKISDGDKEYDDEEYTEDLYETKDESSQKEDDFVVVTTIKDTTVTSTVPTTENTVEITTTQPTITTQTTTFSSGYYAVSRDKMYSDDWIFLSDQIILTEEYLEKFTQEELSFLTNEIYARHGYIFKKDHLYNYFITKDWYSPRIDTMEEAAELFNETEQENIKVIVAFERAKGYRE